MFDQSGLRAWKVRGKSDRLLELSPRSGRGAQTHVCVNSSLPRLEERAGERGEFDEDLGRGD